MRRHSPCRLLIVSLGLLTACTAAPSVPAGPPSSAGTGIRLAKPTTPSNPAPGGQASGADDVPTVPRLTRPAQPNCSARGAVSRLGGGDLARLKYVTFSPGLTAQANAATLAGLLLGTRTDINTRYYGFSGTDVQALHETWEATFRKTFGSLTQPISSQADALMDEYVAGVNDEHTFYLDAQAYQAFSDQSSGAPTSGPRFGFRFAAVPGEDGAVLTDIGADSPAEKAGLRRGDTVLSVNGAALVRGGDGAAASARYSEVLDQAAAGQSVRLDIRRGETLLTVNVTPSTISSGSLPSGRLDGPTYLLRIPSFAAPGTAQRVHDLVRQAQALGASRMVVDLRDDGGGLLVEATGVSAAFAPALAGQTLEFLDAEDVTFFYEDGQVKASDTCFSGSQVALTLQRPAVWTGQLAVLVNASSASASEVVTQLLQKAGASALGETTVGVGNTATNILPLPGDRGLSVTVARSRALDRQYLTARVTPDALVKDDLKALAHGRDLPLEAALAWLR